jgi:hypothetical protein
MFDSHLKPLSFSTLGKGSLSGDPSKEQNREYQKTEQIRESWKKMWTNSDVGQLDGLPEREPLPKVQKDKV